MAKTLNIVYGFDASQIHPKIEALLNGYDVSCYMRHSKIGLLEHLSSTRKCDVLILQEDMPSGKFVVEEILWLKEEFDIKVIPLLNSSWRGSNELAELYNNGVLLAEFPRLHANADLASIIAMLIMHGRNHSAAKTYYRITDKVV